MSLDAAMQNVASMSGSAFEPRMSRSFNAGIAQWTSWCNRIPVRCAGRGGCDAIADIRIAPSAEPASGLEHSAPLPGAPNEADFLSSIASARQEAQIMFEISQDLGNSLSLGETLRCSPSACAR